MNDVFAQIGNTASNDAEIALSLTAGYGLLTLLVPIMILFITVFLFMMIFSLSMISAQLRVIVELLELQAYDRYPPTRRRSYA